METAARAQPAPSELIGGRYRAVRELGHGAISQVLLAEDIRGGSQVALKLLHERYRGSERVRMMLRTEAKALSALSHEGIVRLLDAGDDHLVLEHIDGFPSGRFHYNERSVLVLAAEACAALAAAHSAGIVHRDIKPDHLMVVHGRLKLIDFGYAKMEGLPDYSRIAGHDIGTPAYMAPEQTWNAWTVDNRADLYSLGVVMYEKLSGSVPFEDEDAKRVMNMHRYDQPEPLRSASPPVREVVHRALAKKPSDRFTDAAEMLEAIERAARAVR